MISYGEQDSNQSDIDTVIGVLKADILTQRPQVPLFEKTIFDYCDAEFSATSTLQTIVDGIVS